MKRSCLLVGWWALAGCPDKNTSETGSDSDTPTDTTPIDTDTTPVDTDTTPIDTDTTPTDGLFDFRFTGSGYNPHAGQLMEAALVHNGTDTVVASTSLTVPKDGNIEFVFTDVLEKGENYVFAWYADLNEDGVCNPPPDDHGWVKPVPNVPTDVDTSQNHSITNLVDVCEYFPPPV